MKSRIASEIKAPLDPNFQPAALFNRYCIRKAKASGNSAPLIIALERGNGLISRFETVMPRAIDADTIRYVERIVKFLLWARGGWRIWLGAPKEIGEHIRSCYADTGIRKFDSDLMTKVYERPFEVVWTAPESVPDQREMNAGLGGNFEGCRLGFDLGASDYKVAALMDGEVVYSNEFTWNPASQANPEYHFDHLDAGLRMAAEHLPRVDAIGGSSAGVIVDNKIMVASLFRNVLAAEFEKAKSLFLRIQKKWKVPLEVANDGDVAALAGSISLRANGMLGIAMGSSEAAGYINPRGFMTGWLNELAFAPVDYHSHSAIDEWSSDYGVGALYLSQQAVSRLLPAAGIMLPKDLTLPERLKEVQRLMAAGDGRTANIYETIGVYLGYSAPHYAEFYDFSHMLILGRVTSGDGGGIILETARNVLKTEFPELAEKISLFLPDEKSRRVGQAVAAASLPDLKKTKGPQPV
jgi:predicted NBD/HSP70 family sugar kinase